MMGDMAQISSAEIIADIGSGILGPAKIWNSQYPSLQISSVNVNFSQLASVEPAIYQNSILLHECFLIQTHL